jgi:hypothetical protein
MLLGLLFNNLSAKAQTRATSPNLEPSMERPGESTRTLPFARRSMLDRLTSPALRNISDVTSVSTRPGGMAKSTAETSETFVVFDESYLNGIALQENTSENPEPEPDDWQTFEIILFDRNESGRLDRVTYNYQEEPGLLEKDISDLTYDELGRLSRVTVTYEETYEGNLTTSEVFESYEYEYDESGRLSKYTENYLLGDEEEEESPETVVYEFVYGESSVEASIVSSLSVTDTLRVTYTEGQNLTYVITYPDEGTYRTTHYGIPDVETYLKMSDTSYRLIALISRARSVLNDSKS